jgi:Transcriptional regulators
MTEKNLLNTSISTAGESVYSFLRKKIIELEIKPGELININELSEYLNVSRSPIRDALMQLEKEGLVTTVAKKGTTVSKIHIQRVKDERFLRACIEEKIIEEFLEVYTDNHIEKIKAIIEEQRIAAKSNNSRDFLRLDDVFHSIFFDYTDRLFCLDVVQNMSGHYSRIRLLSLSESDIMLATLKQHEEILQLILDKNLNALKKFLIQHITEKKSEVCHLTSKYPDLFMGIVDIKSEKQNIWEMDFLNYK